jgi:hypothetical protein
MGLELNPRTCTPNPVSRLARARAGPHPLGVVGEPAAGCIPSLPPVGGWGRLGASSWPRIRRWDRRRCCRRISGPPGGPEIRWVLSVGWCPSKRVVVIHCIHRAEGVRRARNSHFKLLAQVAIASGRFDQKLAVQRLFPSLSSWSPSCLRPRSWPHAGGCRISFVTASDNAE